MTRVEIVKKIFFQVIYRINRISNPIFGGDTDAFILCYHAIDHDNWRYSISVNEFKRQIQKIRESKTILSLSEIIKRKRENLKNCAAITIDDGYRSNLLDIFKYLKKSKIHATLFMIGDPDRADRHELENRKKFLSDSDVKKIHKMGFEIGFHSKTHPNLILLSDDKLKEEIQLGKLEFAKKIGCKIKYFAYPKGLYSEKIIKYVKRAGFKAAFTVSGGALENSHDKFKINRICMEKVIEGKQFDALITRTGLLFDKYFQKFLVKKALLTEKILSI